MTGTAIGLLRMILDFTYPSPPCDSPDNRPLIIARVHYMYFAMILTAITFLTTLIVSKFTGKQEVYKTFSNFCYEFHILFCWLSFNIKYFKLTNF